MKSLKENWQLHFMMITILSASTAGFIHFLVKGNYLCAIFILIALTCLSMFLFIAAEDLKRKSKE